MVKSLSLRLRFGQEFVFTGSWISLVFSKLIARQDLVIFVKGPLGNSIIRVKPVVNTKLIKNSTPEAGVYFSSINREGGALIGTYSSVLRQNVNGLIKPFVAFVEVRGLGYKIRCISAKSVEFNVGFSHACLYELNEVITARAVGSKARVIELTSTSWLLLRQAITDIKNLRPAGVYNERGIYEKGEKAYCKDGKKKKFG